MKKRITAIILTMAMLFMILPAMTATAAAGSATNGDITITWTDPSVNVKISGEYTNGSGIRYHEVYVSGTGTVPVTVSIGESFTFEVDSNATMITETMSTTPAATQVVNLNLGNGTAPVLGQTGTLTYGTDAIIHTSTALDGTYIVFYKSLIVDLKMTGIGNGTIKWDAGHGTPAIPATLAAVVNDRTTNALIAADQNEWVIIAWKANSGYVANVTTSGASGDIKTVGTGEDAFKYIIFGDGVAYSKSENITIAFAAESALVNPKVTVATDPASTTTVMQGKSVKFVATADLTGTAYTGAAVATLAVRCETAAGAAVTSYDAYATFKDGVLTIKEGAPKGMKFTATATLTVGGVAVEADVTTAAVTVVERPAPAIAITPATATVARGSSQAFTIVPEADALFGDYDFADMKWTVSGSTGNKVVGAADGKSATLTLASTESLATVTVTATLAPLSTAAATVKSLTATASVSVVSGGGGGSGSGSTGTVTGGTGSGTGTTTPDTGDITVPGAGETAPVVSTVNVDIKAEVKDGAATASVDAKTAGDALKKASDALAKGENADEIIVKLTVSADKAESIDLTVAAAAFDEIAAASDKDTDVSIIFETPVGNITFDDDAVAAIKAAGAGDLKIVASVVDNDKLDKDIAAIVGDRPVYDFKVLKGGKAVTDFKLGTLTITVPYTLGKDEDPNAIVVYYIGENGELTLMRGAFKNGKVTFVTHHLSMYYVEYVEVKYDDVQDTDWFAGYATFMGARELILGVGVDGNFAGNTALTRGELLSTLMNAYNVELTAEKDIPKDFKNFADFDEDSIYADYIITAKIKGITTGYEDDTFREAREVTREEMFTFLARVLDSLGETPKAVPKSIALDKFSDAGKVQEWAVKPIDTLLKAGLINGVSDTDLVISPKGGATRAQMSALVQRLISGDVVTPTPKA